MIFEIIFHKSLEYLQKTYPRFLEVLHHKVYFKSFKCDLDIVGLWKRQSNQDPDKQVTKVYFQRRNKLN